MERPARSRLLSALILTALAGAASAVPAAGAFPNRPVRIIVPYNNITVE